jgi:drug/metabolite transporter (DMT)-like permease
VIHIGYYIALVGAYRHGELGLTYPIMRGCAPLLVALASSAFLGETPSRSPGSASLGITAGVALVGLAHPGESAASRARRWPSRSPTPRSSRCTPSSTGSACAQAGSALRYVMVLFVLDGISYPLGVWLRRNAAARREIVRYAAGRWPAAMLGGGASIGSYTIALWAMTRAPVASVAALRETSVLFAALLGTLLLKSASACSAQSVPASSSAA